MAKFIEVITSPYLLFGIAGIVLLFNFLKRNNNFFDFKAIVIQQFAIFKNCKGQIFVFYIVPLILAIGVVKIKLVDKDIINNINIVLSIFISMLFAMLSIVNGYEKKNRELYAKLLDETNNTIIFEIILCIIILLLSFAVLFIDNFANSIPLLITSLILYYLMFTIILHVFIIIKRMKNLYDNK